MNDGYIYCFSNQSMPGIVKIGMTTRTPGERAKELYTTGLLYLSRLSLQKKCAILLKKKRVSILFWKNIMTVSTLAENSFVFHLKKFVNSLT